VIRTTLAGAFFALFAFVLVIAFVRGARP